MAFHKTLVATAVGGVLGVASVSALADFAIDTNTNPVKFAEEIKADDSTKPKLPTGGTGLEKLTTKMGWGFNTGDTVYIRLDLTMGGSSGKVKFAANPMISASIGNATVSAGDLDPLDGGSGETYAIYKINTLYTATLPTDQVEFSFGTANAFEIASTAGDIEVTYSVSTNEDLNSSNSLYSKKASVVSFAKSFDFSSSVTKVATADVESNFLKFKNDQSTAVIGQFKFIGNGETKISEGPAATTATTASVGAIFSTDTTLDINGDFTMTEETPGSGDYSNAKTRVFISSSDNCSSTDVATANTVAADKATFTQFNSDIGTSSAENYLCITANGSSIVEGAYTATLNPKGVDNTATTGGTAYSITGDLTLNVGNIERNGTQLITPYLTIADGYISRVMLSNTGALDIAYSTTIITDDGATASSATGASGTIKAGTNLHIDTADSGKSRPYLVDSFSGKPRGAALFTFVGANSDIQGVYQTINTANGEIQSIIMQRPGGGDGQ